MDGITFSKNRLKEIAKLQQKKYRESQGLFIAEGEKVLDELLDRNIEIIEVYSLKQINNKKIKVPVHIIDEISMKKITSTESASSIVTVAKQRKEDIALFKKLNRLILIDSIADPGNLGTIIRSSAAFGVEGIILYGDCVDLYSPKVIRSACGNFFKIPILKIKSKEDLEQNFKNHIKVSTSLSKVNNIDLEYCKQIEQYIIMFGAEARGLSPDLTSIAEKNIKLDMKNNVESLNLAVCVSIILYELEKD